MEIRHPWNKETTGTWFNRAERHTSIVEISYFTPLFRQLRDPKKLKKKEKKKKKTILRRLAKVLCGWVVLSSVIRDLLLGYLRRRETQFMANRT